ncbi:MAG: hypothetical protein AABX51_03080, partial [Nanoarchaeota archaeon]
VLATFGAVDPSNIIPDRCVFPVNLACTDHSVVINDTASNNGSVSFSLVNNGATEIRITRVNVTGQGIAVPCIATTIPSAYPVVMEPDDEQLFVVTPCTFTPQSSKKMKYDVFISHEQVGYTSSKTVKGEIFTKREGAVS